MKGYFIVFSLLWSSVFSSAQETNFGNRISNGAWCWFSSPRAIYLQSSPSRVITGWITKDGTLEAGLLDVKRKHIYKHTIKESFEQDDHANPSFAESDKGNVLMFYTKHVDEMVRMNQLFVSDSTFYCSDDKRFNIFNEDELKLFPGRQITTYANPFVLKREKKRIYCFGRWTGFKPNITWSDDGGESFEKSKVFITNEPFCSKNRPYVLYYSDGKSKIHFLFTDGHPRNEKVNSIYYAYYEKDAFWRADDSKICNIDALPFTPKEASVVYEASEKEGRAWIYDIGVNKRQGPVILYARYPNKQTHLYHYAYYDGKNWVDNQICNAGKWFPQTRGGKIETETYYSGGMTINPLNTNIIYLSRSVNGIFEIEKFTTHDNGQTWSIKAITESSRFDNVRPVVPRNMKKRDKPIVLWMTNRRYVHYTDYDTDINFHIDE